MTVSQSAISRPITAIATTKPWRKHPWYGQVSDGSPSGTPEDQRIARTRDAAMGALV
jgi:hypothetical protein